MRRLDHLLRSTATPRHRRAAVLAAVMLGPLSTTAQAACPSPYDGVGVVCDPVSTNICAVASATLTCDVSGSVAGASATIVTDYSTDETFEAWGIVVVRESGTDVRHKLSCEISDTVNEVVIEGSRHDLMYGGPGPDDMEGGSGDDTMHGDAGNDVMSGGVGDDTMDGGTNTDVLCGGPGGDSLDDGDTDIDAEKLWADSDSGDSVTCGTDSTQEGSGTYPSGCDGTALTAEPPECP